MEIVNFIFNIIVIVLICLVVFFTKNYLPSYMDKKGENLATKEDIENLDAVVGLGYKIECRQVPSDKPVSYEKVRP